MRGKPKFLAGVATPLESLRIGPRPAESCEYLLSLSSRGKRPLRELERLSPSRTPAREGRSLPFRTALARWPGSGPDDTSRGVGAALPALAGAAGAVGGQVNGYSGAPSRRRLAWHMSRLSGYNSFAVFMHTVDTRKLERLRSCPWCHHPWSGHVRPLVVLSTSG